MKPNWTKNLMKSLEVRTLISKLQITNFKLQIFIEGAISVYSAEGYEGRAIMPARKRFHAFK